MKAIVTAVGILTVGLAAEAADTVRATLEPSTNGPGCFTMRITNVSTNTIRFLDIREGTGWCGEFYEVIVEKGGVTNASRGNCLYSPAGMPETVELAPGRVYGRDIQPVAYVRSERHLAPPCDITVLYRLSDRIKTDWRTSGVNVDLVFQTEKLAIGLSNQPLSADPSALIATLTSTSATWEARCRAEDALTNCSPSRVLTLLLPHTGANRPSGMIWNSAGRDSERDMPADWQRLYAVRRAWDTQARRLTDAEHKTFWLELLAKAGTPGPRVTVIHELTEHWTPAAEPVLSRFIADAGQELPVRVVAGRCLALHAARSTHDQLVSLLERAGSFAEREQWFDIASDPRHKNEVGEDPRIVRQGFALFAEERKRSSNYVHGAYFIAIKLGNYVGAKNQFQPEMTFRYRGSNGPTEAFFSDTVRNAERWWANNREQYAEREARKTVPNLHEALGAAEFGAGLIGRWESAFDLPGRTNVIQAEFRRDGTATVVVAGGERKAKHTGPYRLEFERPPASNKVTFARIVVESDGGALVLSRVNFGLHNGVSQDRMLLRIDGEPHGALERAGGSVSPTRGRPDL